MIVSILERRILLAKLFFSFNFTIFQNFFTFLNLSNFDSRRLLYNLDRSRANSQGGKKIKIHQKPNKGGF
jgi:hypothetical protein